MGYILVKYGSLGMTSSGGGDKVHGQGYSGMEKTRGRGPGAEAAGSSDGTIRSDP